MLKYQSLFPENLFFNKSKMLLCVLIGTKYSMGICKRKKNYTLFTYLYLVGQTR